MAKGATDLSSACPVCELPRRGSRPGHDRCILLRTPTHWMDWQILASMDIPGTGMKFSQGQGVKRLIAAGLVETRRRRGQTAAGRFRWVREVRRKG